MVVSESIFCFGDGEEGTITYSIASHCAGESVIKLWVFLGRFTALRVGIDVYATASISSD